MKDNFCVVPFTQMEIGTTGKVRPCCEYNGFVGNINDNSFLDTFNNEQFQELRDQFTNNIAPEGCKKCFTQEAASIESRRQQENTKCSNITTPVPIKLDLKFSNICNMKCRICDSNNSRLWEKEETIIFGRPNNKGQSGKWIYNLDRWKELEGFINTLETFYISGGEPLLVKENFQFIQQCIEQNKAKDITLRIITNGSVKIPEKILEYFKQFKSVELMYSIDDIDDRFTYQRYPIKFSKVENNFKDILKHDYLKVSLIYTVSIHNCLSGQLFLEWCDSIGIPHSNIFVNFVGDPDYYDISVLSQQDKDKIVEHLTDNYIDNQIKQYLTTQFREVNLEYINDIRNKIIDKVDKLRNQKFSKLFPIMAEILKL